MVSLHGMGEGNTVIGPNRLVVVIHQFHQRLVVDLTMVALVIVVDHSLPVGGDLSLEASDTHQIVEPRATSPVRALADRCVARRGVAWSPFPSRYFTDRA